MTSNPTSARHVVSFAFEALAFEPRLMRGGTAGLAWNLAREYARAGHRSTVITPAHGHAHHLAAAHGATLLGSRLVCPLPLVLDPEIWADRAPLPTPTLSTEVWHLRKEGVDVFALANHFLDLLPDDLYPANELLGRDLAYFKPLAFQTTAIAFLDSLDLGPVQVQAFEPLFSYLVAAAYSGRADRTVMTTVAMNPSVLTRVYKPQLAASLSALGVAADLDRFDEPPADDVLGERMATYLRPTHQERVPGADYVSPYALVAHYSDVLDFVSSGQRSYVSAYRGAPAGLLFSRSTAARVQQATCEKQLVGGCGIPDWWLDRTTDRAAGTERADVLRRLGLDPDRPTIYHAARFDQNHKGQLELFRALDTLLAGDPEVNVLVRCATGIHGVVGQRYFVEVAERHPDSIRLAWSTVDEARLFEEAAAADFCVFPSKFEMDGFLITMAEAMACGAVPIATAQETLGHFHHSLSASDPRRTGYSVPRSFRADDPALAAALQERLVEALRVFREDPAQHRELADRCRRLARTFHWRGAAERRLRGFEQAGSGTGPADRLETALEHGWFHLLSDDDVRRHAPRIAAAAHAHANPEAYARCRPLTEAVALDMFDTAYAMGDFVACTTLTPRLDPTRRALLARRCETHDRGDTLRVVYRNSVAERVDLVTPVRSGPDPGSGNRYLEPLTRAGSTFSGVFPREIVGAEPILLLGLPGGDVAWDAPMTRP
jgi:glycosyltransferase involved in cell wall biosynthesis